MEIVVPQPYHGGGMNEENDDSSSDDDLDEQDISPENPFLQDDAMGEVEVSDEDDSDDESDIDSDSENEDPDIVNMVLNISRV